MSDPPSLSLWSLNNLNSYNSKKGFPAEWIETSKDGQVGINQGGEKKEEFKDTIDSALKPGEGMNQAVDGTPFSWEEQRDLVSITAEVSSTSCGWAQGWYQGREEAQRGGHGCLAIGMPERDTKP